MAINAARLKKKETHTLYSDFHFQHRTTKYRQLIMWNNTTLSGVLQLFQYIMYKIELNKSKISSNNNVVSINCRIWQAKNCNCWSMYLLPSDVKSWWLPAWPRLKCGLPFISEAAHLLPQWMLLSKDFFLGCWFARWHWHFLMRKTSMDSVTVNRRCTTPRPWKPKQLNATQPSLIFIIYTCVFPTVACQNAVSKRKNRPVV